MNSIPPLRVGIIGCGRMGLSTPNHVRNYLPSCWLPLSHSEAASSHPDLELVGLCDTFVEARQHASIQYPDLPIYSDPNLFLKELDLDFVCIATRTPERPDLINLCLDHGIRHFHLEKPLCTSLKDLTQLRLRFAQLGVHATFGTLRRYLPAYVHAKDLVNDGLIGTLKDVQLSLGNGGLCWTQIHAIDLVNFAFRQKRVLQVRAYADPDSYQINGNILDGDPRISLAHFLYTDNCQAIVTRTGTCDFYLHGDLGSLSVLNDGSQLFHRTCSEGDNPYHSNFQQLDIPPNSPTGTLSALHRHTVTSDHSSIDTEDLIMTQLLTLACAQSIISDSKPVSPFDLDPNLVVTGRSGSLFA